MTVLLDRNLETAPGAANVDTFENHFFLVPDDTNPGKAVLGVHGYDGLNVLSQDLEAFLAQRSPTMEDATPRELAVFALKGEVSGDLSSVYIVDKTVEANANTESKDFVYSLEVDQAEFVKSIVINLAEKRQKVRVPAGQGEPAYAWLGDSNASRPEQVGINEKAEPVYAVVQDGKIVEYVEH